MMYETLYKNLYEDTQIMPKCSNVAILHIHRAVLQKTHVYNNNNNMIIIFVDGF